MEREEIVRRIEKVKELRRNRAALDREIAELLADTPYDPVLANRLICLRCGYGDVYNGHPEWISMSWREPKNCTRCHSPSWNIAPVTRRSRRPIDPPNPKWYLRDRRAAPAVPLAPTPPPPAVVMTPLRRFDKPAGLPPPPPPSLALTPPPTPGLSEMLREEIDPDPDVDILARRMPNHPLPHEPLDSPEVSEEDRLCNCGREIGGRHAIDCRVFESPPFEESDAETSKID
jgi:hypothetical protein